MGNKMSVISYTLATIASVCFISGLVVLSGEGRGQANEQDRNHTIYA
jgi:hypothetical protein